MRKQQFKRPEPGFSMYEGRTRGKRMKYTYSDEEDDIYSDTTSRRSTRNTGTHTPAEPAAPTVTQSGRQVRSRHGGAYGESLLNGTRTSSVAAPEYYGTSEQPESENDDVITGRRPRRAAAIKQSRESKASRRDRSIDGYDSEDDMDEEDEEDEVSEQDYGDYEEDEDAASLASDGDNDDLSDEDVDMADDLAELEADKKSPVVALPAKSSTPEKKPTIKLKVSPGKKPVEDDLVAENIPNRKLFDAEISSNDPSNTGSRSTDTNKAESSTDNGAPTASGQRVQSNTLSPSLAYRASPEKPHAFPQPIHVGQGGS